MTTEAATRALAESLGLRSHWVDVDGFARIVAIDALRALASALGYPCASRGEIDASRDRLAALRSAERSAPLVTAEVGRPLALPDVARGTRYRFTLEDGSRSEGSCDASGSIAAPDAAGYHALDVGERTLTVAVAPPRCFAPHDIGPPRRRFGVAAQVYALGRSGDAGIGDFGAVAEIAECAAHAGADAVAISPAHAMFASAPERRSPYSPSSRYFLNALLVDPSPRFDAAEVAAAAQEAGVALDPERTDLIDWPREGRAKLALLRALYRRAEAAHAIAKELDRYAQRDGERLRRHAEFEAARAAPGANTGANEMRFHVFVQWLAELGLARAQERARSAGMDIGLIPDLAVGTDPEGSDAASGGDEFLQRITIGAPPDHFSREGQDWGLTTFSPLTLRSRGFAGYIDLLRANMRHGGGLRIDHLMGLARLWVVPAGAGSAHGAYLGYPHEDLFRLLALESWRHRCLIVGEDLGVVPEGFRELMRARGILGTEMLWFARDGAFRKPDAWREHAVAMTSSHDVPTLAGWWRGGDIEQRARFAAIDVEAACAERERDRRALVRAIREALPQSTLDVGDGAAAFVADAIAFVGSTRCELVLLPLEDAFALEEQSNVPGTVDEHPNWRRRLPRDTASALASPIPYARLRTLAAARAS
jgi:4-alpha-glucanotransferase